MGVWLEVGSADFHVEVIDLLGGDLEAEIGVAFLVVAYRTLPKNSPQPSLTVLGDMRIQSNVSPVRSLFEPL